MRKINLLFFVIFFVTSVQSQETYFNPLSRWATHNVGDPGTFTTGSEQSAPGKFYQFGRNIAFPATGYVSFDQGVLSPQDARVWENLFLFPTDLNTRSSSNWFSTVRDDLDSWVKVIDETMLTTGAPSTYLGNNGGDPCPEGWHIPKLYEYTTIIQNTFVFDQETNKVDQAETVDLYGNNNFINSTADYKKIDTNTVGALRFKGTSNVTAFRYRLVDHWVTGAHIEIRAKYAGTASINDIIAWTDTDWSTAVVRYFPLPGYRLNFNAGFQDQQYPSNANKEGYYWVDYTYKSIHATTFHNKAMTLGLTGWNQANRVFGSVASARDMGNVCRCIKDYDPTTDPTTNINLINGLQLNVWSGNGKIHIDVEKTDLPLSIVTVSGKTIYSGRTQSGTFSVPVLSGVYLVKTGNMVKKVIVL